MLIESFADGKALNIISSLKHFSNVPVYTLLSFKISVSHKQTDKSSSDISFLIKLISFAIKFTHHPTNKKPHECGA